MSGYFIAGSGTDVGKTFVACGLIAALRHQGRRVKALKPVASGVDAGRLDESDPGRLLSTLGEPVTDAAVAAICPWRFTAPLSPDMAAAQESRTVDFDAVVKFSAAAHAGEILLVEGVGGVMVPLDARHTTLDWMTALKFPVVLVGGSYLGAISHTLSALEVVRQRGLEVAAVVVSESLGGVALSDTLATLVRFTAPLTPLAIPRDPARQAAAFAGLADLL